MKLIGKALRILADRAKYQATYEVWLHTSGKDILKRKILNLGIMPKIVSLPKQEVQNKTGEKPQAQQ